LTEAKLTPVFKQYHKLKGEYPDTVLLFRLGDFYEMFGDDARLASSILEITLTGRDAGEAGRIPMCGVPYHSAARYIRRLVEAGLKVAIAEQMEDPAKAKGLVKRDVVRVVTAGTAIEDDLVAEDAQNFLVALAYDGGEVGIAALEASGGTVAITCTKEPAVAARELKRLAPAEVLLDKRAKDAEKLADVNALLSEMARPTTVFDVMVRAADAEFYIKRLLGVETLDAFGAATRPAVQLALFYLVKYLRETFKVESPQIHLAPYSTEEYLMLDEHTLRHLEIADSTSGAPTLYAHVNRCVTPMGRRLLKGWLKRPSRTLGIIRARHQAVAALIGSGGADDLREKMRALPDLERIVTRVAYRKSNPRELSALSAVLARVPEIAQAASAVGLSCPEVDLSYDGVQPLADLLSRALTDDPPVIVGETPAIRSEFDPEVARLRAARDEGVVWFTKYEVDERARTGIRTLKVKYTGAFGYFIEVTKANLHLVPQGYIRKQTLVNAERYMTSDLAEREALLRDAAEKLLDIEREHVEKLYAAVTERADDIHRIAASLAALDSLVSLAAVARDEAWVVPEMAESGAFAVEGGRHPLVERAVGRERFVANDVTLDPESSQVAIITGPNMGGKSTFIRMAATIAVLAHAGSFVPAEKARVPLLDRIFTRIGAVDAVTRGQSTFMVEMVEVAEILSAATSQSLVLLDEVGRGTSTYDGISIAKAVVEYLHRNERALPLTLFATHYFELTDLGVLLARVKNFKVDVMREGSRLVFLYKVMPGSADESFGIEVARLAGLPKEVVARAGRILRELEKVKRESLVKSRKVVQAGLFGEDAAE